MDLERFSATTRSLENLLRDEFIFPVNLAASEPRFIVLFSVLLVFIGLVLSLYPIISVCSKMGRWNRSDFFMTLTATPLVIIGVLNTAILFTSPQEGWKESDRYQSYIELAGFLNQAHHYSHSPFDMNWPSRLEFIHLQRAASYEIWKATKHEVTRKLLDDRP